MLSAQSLADGEKKKNKSNGNAIRQLWDTVWLRKSRRKVSQQQQENGQKNGKCVEKRSSGGSSARSSKTELRDGFDFQTILDLDHNQKIELTFYGYKECVFKSMLYYLILIISFGFMRLVFHWNNHWGLIVRRRRCGLREATYMLIMEKYKHSEGSHHDAIHSEAMQREEEQEHEVYFVEKVNKVGVEEVKEQFLAERRTGVEQLAKKQPLVGDEQLREKWFERFLKKECLFEKPEMEVKIKKQDGDEEGEHGKMSKSPDTVTTLVLDDEVNVKGGAGDGPPEVKRAEEIKIHEHFLKFLHFSVHFDNGVFEGEEEEWIKREMVVR